MNTNILTEHIIEVIDKQIIKDGGAKLVEVMAASITRGYAINKKGEKIACMYGREYEIELANQTIAYVKNKNIEALKLAEIEAYN